MSNTISKRGFTAVLVLALVGFGSSPPTLAHGGGGGAHGGGGGGGHFGGGSHFAGGGHFGGGGRFAGGGYRGGGYRGGYGGYRGGYGGFRGGYGRWGGYGWGLGGLGLGLYFATLPYYYSTFWAGGVPYYYADDNYYQWDGSVGQYETVNPPAEIVQQVEAQSPSLIAYPKNGQSEAQQATDKTQCLTWASAQSGFDPSQDTAKAQGGAQNDASSQSAYKRSQFMRAEAACLDGRGYSVK